MKKEHELHLLRLIACFAVVMTHTLFIWKNTPEAEHRYTAHVFFSALRFCVPVFILISGMLILPKEYNSLGDFYRRRLLRILPQAIIFAIPFYLVRYFLKGESISEIIKYGLVYGSAWEHYWYVYMILVLYFFSPFIGKMVKQLKGNEVLFLAASLFGLTWLSEVYFYFSHKETIWIFLSFRYFGYYILGYYLSFNKAFKTVADKKWLLVLLYVSATLVINFSETKLTYSYTSFFVLLQAISISLLVLHTTVKERKWVSTLSKHSYSIYLVHPLIFYFVNAFIIRQNLLSGLNPLYFIVLFGLAGLLLSFGIVFIVNKAALKLLPWSIKRNV